MKKLSIRFLAVLATCWSLLTGCSKAETHAKGVASWYGEAYRGKTMANGQPFDPDALTCAAWNWPLGTVLSVRYRHPRGYYRSDYRSVMVTVTDRGPDKRLNRLIDLSSRAFRHLAGDLGLGLIDVEVTALRKEDGK